MQAKEVDRQLKRLQQSASGLTVDQVISNIN